MRLSITLSPKAILEMDTERGKDSRGVWIEERLEAARERDSLEASHWHQMEQ